MNKIISGALLGLLSISALSLTTIAAGTVTANSASPIGTVGLHASGQVRRSGVDNQPYVDMSVPDFLGSSQ